MPRLWLPLVTIILLFPVAGLGQTPPKNSGEDRSFSPQLFHPAPGPDEFVTVESARPLPHLSWSLGLFLNYSRDPISIGVYDSATHRSTGADTALLAHALGGDLYAALGLFKRFQLGLALPMTLYQTGTDLNSALPVPMGTHIAAPNGFAFGDPRLHLKALIYGKAFGPQFAISHWLSFPFGNDSSFGGEQHFSGFAGEPRILAGWEQARWRVGLFFGLHWRAHTSEFFSTVQGQQLTYGGAAAFDVLPHKLTLLAEIYGHSNSLNSVSTSGVSFSDSNDNPLEVDIAGRLMVIPDLSLTLGVGYAILDGIGAAQPRLYLGVVYAPDARDRDHDGVRDSRDFCPDDPEDRDGFKDDDGCPDPDNDGDTIPDKQDKCPNQPEDFDEFEDDDGCPDPDNDKDGIPDIKDACPRDPEDHKGAKPNDGCPLSKTDTDGDGITDDKDKCPTDPEDKDGFQDEDGCPDPDNDDDGIPDNFDQCPNEPEDMDGFQDDDGCPDPDNDKDGVPDKQDKCPNEPETINGYQDEDGCPDKGPPSKVMLDKGQIVILDKIFFDAEKATIKPVSFGLLDQVAQVIRGHAELKFRIEGHTDSQGSPDKNLELSQKRADAVRTYLVSKGIDPSRLLAVGYGSGVPIADNKTQAGREANRRVEFHIVEEKKKPKEEVKPGEDDKPDENGNQ